MKNYVFSFGSLINKISLELTIGHKNASKAREVVIEGFERGWRNHVHTEQRTGLGIIKKEGAKVNGVIFEVNEDYLSALDQREYGFERKEIKEQHFVEGRLYTYFIINPLTPTEEFPIALTYVDTVLSGCLTHSEDFAREFLKDTVNWEYPFINDRNNPRYPRREDLDQKRIQIINKLFKEVRPEEAKRLSI